MFVADIFEAPQKHLIVIYPGRFQPFHKGHKAVYDYLSKKYGRDAVYIATSNKTDNLKSPFSFSDKSQFMAATGVSLDRVIESKQPYQVPEFTSKLDPNTTIMIYAVSEKDMAEDPRFASWTKKDGSPSHFQPLPADPKDMLTFSHHSYIEVVPTFDFKVLGQSMRSATEVRAQYKSADDATKQAIIKDLFGKYTPELQHIMDTKLGTLEEGQPSLEQVSHELVISYINKILDDIAVNNSNNIRVHVTGLIKELSNLPNKVKLLLPELVDELALQVSHWPKNNIDVDRTKNLISILQQIKEIVELNDPLKNIHEGKFSKALSTAALAAGLSMGSPAQASDNPVADVLGAGILGARTVAAIKGINKASVQGELNQELRNIARGDKNASRLHQLSNKPQEIKNDPQATDQDARDRMMRGESIKEEASGYIPKNSKEAKDPRWERALSVDVRPDTMRKEIAAFYPTKPQDKRQKQVKEGIIDFNKQDPMNSVSAPPEGFGSMPLRDWKKSLARRLKELTAELEQYTDPKLIDKNIIWDKVKYLLDPKSPISVIARDIARSHEELEAIRRKGGSRSRGIQS